MGLLLYINKKDRQRFTSVEDKELNELFKRVQEITNNSYLLEEIIEELPRFLFFKSETIIHYSLYVKVDMTTKHSSFGEDSNAIHESVRIEDRGSFSFPYSAVDKVTMEKYLNKLITKIHQNN